MKKRRIAWVGVEPTPYNFPLFALLRENEQFEFSFFFCTRQNDQPWTIPGEQTLIAAESAARPWSVLGRPFNPAIVRAILRRPWDAVVVAGYGLPTMQAVIIACLLRRIPFLIWSDTQLLRHRSWWKPLIKRLLVFPAVRRCGAALGAGRMACKYWESVGIPSDRIFLVSCANHLGNFRLEPERREALRSRLRQEAGIPDDATVGICIGRLVACKGLDLLLGGAGLLDPTQRPYLLLVGDGPERPALEQFVRAHSLPVKFLGFRQNEELPGLLAAADFFVLPSRADAWGVAVAEAMAMGLPVVLSDQVGAAYDLLEDGRNGYLVSQQSSAAWRTALGRCITEKDKLKAMGERSLEIIASWTREASADQLWKAIDVALARS
jgi:glycosyltransferase involved in cell wall biosynthesis